MNKWVVDFRRLDCSAFLEQLICAFIYQNENSLDNSHLNDFNKWGRFAEWKHSLFSVDESKWRSVARFLMSNWSLTPNMAIVSFSQSLEISKMWSNKIHKIAIFEQIWTNVSLSFGLNQIRQPVEIGYRMRYTLCTDIYCIRRIWHILTSFCYCDVETVQLHTDSIEKYRNKKQNIQSLSAAS